MSVSIIEIRDLILEVRDAVKELNVEMEKTASHRKEWIQLHSLTVATLSLIDRAGLGDTADEIVHRVQQIIRTIWLLYSALMQLYIATGPVGWLLGGVSMAAGFSGMMASYRL